MCRFCSIAAALLLLASPCAFAAERAGQTVPAPTAAGQIPVSVASGLSFTYAPVTFSPDGVHFTFGGGTASASSVITANVTAAGDGGLRINLPSGATGQAIGVYSSTGTLLAGVSPSGVGNFTGGQAQGLTLGSTASNAEGYGTVLGYAAKTLIGTDTVRPWGTAIGYGASATDAGVAIGFNSTAGSDALAIGFNTSSTGNNTIAIGGAAVSGQFSIGLGQSTVSGGQAFAEGYGAQATGLFCIADGGGCNASGNGAMAFGYSVSATANQAIFGANPGAYGIKDVCFGDGYTNASPLNTTYHATGGSGTNIAGATMTLAGGQSTGTGAEGVVNIATGGSGATGTALNALTNRVQVSQNGLTVLGAGAVNSPAYQVGGISGYTGVVPTTAQSLNYHGGILTGYINSAGTQVGNP